MASEKKSSDAFEAALKRALAGASREDAHDCPAPEVLAAYYDRSLSRIERARLDSHLMSCVRCQSMMAAIARADDSPLSPARAETARGFLYFARVAAPIAVIGATIAFVVGMRTRKQPPPPEVIALASPAPQIEKQLAVRAAAPASAPLVAPGTFASSAMPGGHASAAGAPAGPHHHKLKSLPAPILPRREIGSQQLAKAEKASPEVASPNAAPPEESFNAAAPAPAAPPLQIPAAAGAAPAIVARNENAAAGTAVSGSTAMSAAAPIVNRITSPDGSVIWQFGSGGTIMRTEGTRSWLTMQAEVKSDLLAASAPSNDVCWIVGKSGAVVRTLDRGAHWQIVRPPSGDDFTTVTATDSNNATVTASNGNHYVTRDGGVTWSSP